MLLLRNYVDTNRKFRELFKLLFSPLYSSPFIKAVCKMQNIYIQRVTILGFERACYDILFKIKEITGRVMIL
jgi:hypothetical protein